MEHIEYEERVMISKHDYKKVIDDLLSQGYKCQPFTIENIYLDNKDFFITKNDMMLRIRNTSTGIHELTLKIRNDDGSHTEINETLDNHPLIDASLGDKFKEFKEIIRLTTVRIEVPIEDHLFVIDQNTYGNKIDYNFEVEANSQKNAVSIAKKYCEKYKITYKRSPSKSERAFKEFKKGCR